MPQLDSFSFFSLTLYTVMVFLILIYFLQTYIVPKIAETLKARRITFVSNYKSTEHLAVEEEEMTLVKLVKLVKNQEEVIKMKTNG